MNNEQLQMILNALQSLGAEGKTAFIWWLALDKLVPVVGWLLTFCGLVWIALRVIHHISASSEMARLRDELGIGSPGPLWQSEVQEVFRRVRKMRAQLQDAMKSPAGPPT